MSKDKVKEVKKEKDIKEVIKKEIVLRDNKSSKEPEKKKEEPKKAQKEPERKDAKQRETKEVKKEQKATKTRLKGKEELDDSGMVTFDTFVKFIFLILKLILYRSSIEKRAQRFRIKS